MPTSAVILEKEGIATRFFQIQWITVFGAPSTPAGDAEELACMIGPVYRVCLQCQCLTLPPKGASRSDFAQSGGFMGRSVYFRQAFRCICRVQRLDTQTGHPGELLLGYQTYRPLGTKPGRIRRHGEP